MATIREQGRKGGKPSFNVQVRIRGHAPVSRTFRTRREAERWATRTELAIEKGEFSDYGQARRLTLDALLERYYEQVTARMTPKAAASARKHLNWWAGKFAELTRGKATTVAMVTPALVIAAREALEAEPYARSNKPDALYYTRGPATVNRFVASLSALYAQAVEWRLVSRNVVRDSGKRRKEPQHRVRFLSDDERTRLLEACQRSDWPALHALVLLALSTGARRGELIGLRWADLDLKAGRARLATSKNGDPRTLALTGRALEELRTLRLNGGAKSEYVFAHASGLPGPYKHFDEAWSAAKRAAEIENFHFHDLRHSCASYLAADGATLLEIGKVLGHRSVQTTARYSHLLDSRSHELVEQMAKRRDL